uniref:Uncharacterized protein n=1 Tax=Oryza punctata TaxID=4537 RepID=A0A0E0LRX7_ORYPU
MPRWNPTHKASTTQVRLAPSGEAPVEVKTVAAAAAATMYTPVVIMTPPKELPLKGHIKLTFIPL